MQSLWIVLLMLVIAAIVVTIVLSDGMRDVLTPVARSGNGPLPVHFGVP